MAKITEFINKYDNTIDFAFILDNDYNFYWCNNIKKYKEEFYYQITTYITDNIKKAEKDEGSYVDSYKKQYFSYYLSKINDNELNYFLIEIRFRKNQFDISIYDTMEAFFPLTQACNRQSLFALSNCTFALYKMIETNELENQIPTLNLIMKNCFKINKVTSLTNEIYKYSFDLFYDTYINITKYFSDFNNEINSEFNEKLDLNVDIKDDLFIFADESKFTCFILSVINIILDNNDLIKSFFINGFLHDKCLILSISRDKINSLKIATKNLFISKALGIQGLDSVYLALVDRFCKKYKIDYYFDEENKSGFVFKIPISENNGEIIFNSKISEYSNNKYSPIHVFLNDIVEYNFLDYFSEK